MDWMKARLHKGKIQIRWREDKKVRTRTLTKEGARHIAMHLKSVADTLRVLADE
jgi:hypothetical protein